MRAGLVQLCSGDDPVANLPQTVALIEEAVACGAGFVLTPEVTNCVSASRAQQEAVLQYEGADITLAALRDVASARRIWLLIGSLAIKTGDKDGRFANRSFLITPDGQIVARYDKIHMFDVTISESESYRESAGYRPGGAACLAQTSFGALGMTICYDLRFPHLYRALGQRGAQIITVPSAFSRVTGAAHWEVLLRARAIETGAYVLAPAQTGVHAAQIGKPRETYGHSLAISPWGEVLGDAGDAPGVITVDLDPSEVAKSRKRVPSLMHDAVFSGPRNL
ncbi:carbon-nitrogen hydrolase family protein [Roseovarius sp. LXJ103]|uniref:carbon-nitrogen hydrolase family protein n=1 Tax=Roseovarius carneus TaxID=2853164 RepID=UPI000D61E25C|nr:carbon-nitrogen hydrolase family protein [Roseovarius carneus]MBZ8117887.1 carbon-nitrogen hydrolase family protein [Roseovarius carneus]PWE36354.1 amidohydrolase [Pelagicola sp. LXJ1103]